MSDFASLLGKLQDAAKSEKEATANKKKRKVQDSQDQEQQNSRQRQRQEPKIIRPRDAHELKVKVSFFCIGAQKAGTTWLHEMLNRHPNLALPEQKEIHFWDWNRRKGLKWYSNQFPRTRHDCMYGEITPCYAILDCEKIAEVKYLFPDAKLVFLARDLVDRAWSAILMELRNSVRGMEAGEFDNQSNTRMDKKAKEKYLREADPYQFDDAYFMERLMHATHRQRSDYTCAIRRWLKYFPKEQILLLNYDDVSSRPRDLLKEVLSFIGTSNETDKLIKNSELSTRFNAASDPKLRQVIRPGLRKKMEQYLSPFARDFNELLEELGYSWRINAYCNSAK